MSKSENKDDVFTDWSARHVRMRFELVGSAVVLFLFAFYDVKMSTTSLFPISFQNVAESHLFSGVAIFYVFVLVHFYFRTKSEESSLRRSHGRVRDAIAKLKQTRNELDRELENVSSSVMTYLDSVKLDAQKDAEGFRFFMQEYQTVGSVLRVEQEILQSAPDIHNPPNEAIHDLKRRIKTAVEDAFPESRMKTLVQEKEAVLKGIEEIERHVEKRIPEVIKKASQENLTTFSELQKTEMRFEKDREALYLENFVFSCYAPVIASVVLFIFAVGKYWGMPLYNYLSAQC